MLDRRETCLTWWCTYSEVDRLTGFSNPFDVSLFGAVCRWVSLASVTHPVIGYLPFNLQAHEWQNPKDSNCTKLCSRSKLIDMHLDSLESTFKLEPKTLCLNRASYFAYVALTAEWGYSSNIRNINGETKLHFSTACVFSEMSTSGVNFVPWPLEYERMHARSQVPFVSRPIATVLYPALGLMHRQLHWLRASKILCVLISCYERQVRYETVILRLAKLPGNALSFSVMLRSFSFLA